MSANIRNTFQTIADLKARIERVSSPVQPVQFDSDGINDAVDHESYVHNLTLALAGDAGSVENSTPVAGMRMLAYMQQEGVFGISPHGRYHSVIDFIKMKCFEYELEQRPFNVDEFLQETETPIYDILSRGNSSQIAKSLLHAAESVNQFRNQLARSSEQSPDFS